MRMNSRVDALMVGIRRIHAQHAPRRVKARWYVLEPIGWAQYTFQTRQRRYPLSRVYRASLRTLGVRECRSSDSTLRYVLSEPWDAVYTYSGRFACHVLGRHNVTCRGRVDHPR